MARTAQTAEVEEVRGRSLVANCSFGQRSLLPRLRNTVDTRLAVLTISSVVPWRVSNLAAASVFYGPPTLSPSTKSLGESQPVNSTLAPTPKASPASDPPSTNARLGLGSCKRINSHFCCQLSSSLLSLLYKARHPPKGICQGPRWRTCIVEIRVPFLPSIMTAHLLKVRSLDSAARLLTIGL